MNDELERIGKDADVVYLSQKFPRKIEENLINQCPGEDSKENPEERSVHRYM
jgi:hypothetical protein